VLGPDTAEHAPDGAALVAEEAVVSFALIMKAYYAKEFWRCPLSILALRSTEINCCQLEQWMIAVP